MVFEKETITVETRVVSADGHFSRSISRDGSNRDSAVAEVNKYEESAKGVVFNRLVEKGVLKRVLNPKVRCDEHDNILPWDKIEPELYVKKMALNALDDVIDGGSDRTKYWIFTPASEEDIRDLLVYSDIVTGSKLVSTDASKYDKYMGLGAKEIKAGKDYIFAQNDECEWYTIYDIDGMLSQFKSMVGYFADTAKAQRKEIKK